MADLGIRLLREGYDAIEHDRHRRGGGPTYVSRLLGHRAVVLAGRSGAELFYDEDVVERAGVVPAPLARLLFGRGAVHGLDDEAHHDRKQMFLSMLTPGQVAPCAAAVGERLDRAVAEWAGREIDLHTQLVQLYGAAVLGWAGVQCDADQTARLSRWYADIVDGFGFAGRAYARGWRGRRRTDAWARSLVSDVRHGRASVREGSVLEAVAGSGLDEHTAAVELGNVLRPTIAVSWLGAFAAWQLDRTPEWRARLADPAATADRLAFAQEVRRTTPFVPALAGRVRRPATHEGLELRPGNLVVLDVRGINLDPDLHPDPMVFRADRFLVHDPGPFDLVPQGGGFPEGHRCPGESLALQLLGETVRVLAGTEYDVVSRSDVDLRRMPTLPADGPRLHVSAAFPG
jgi:fatty-acid peroxygenase